MNETIQNLMPTVADWGVKIIGAFVLFVIVKTLANKVGDAVERVLKARNFDVTLTKFFAAMSNALIMIAGVLAVLGIFGIETTSFAAILGAAGLAVGLAFQGTLGNFASGVLLLVFRPFNVGDVVTIGGGHAGTVEAIGLFTTTLDTPDEVRIVVGNGAVTGNPIINTSTHPARRVNTAIGIGYGEDIDKAIEVLTAAAREVPGRAQDRDPSVVVTGLGASSVDLSVRVWCHADNYWDVLHHNNRLAKYALDKAGISIPFPQLDVHLDKDA